MSGIEIAGVVLAGPAIVVQLLKFSIDGCNAIVGAQATGKELHRCQRDLDVVRHRLEDWIRNFVGTGGDLWSVLKQDPRRYIAVLETLSSIAEFFAKV